MKVSYGEGVAPHPGPESWAAGREVVGQALTGETIGRVLSRESPFPGADAVLPGGRQHRTSRYREGRVDWAWSKTPRRSGSSLHGNREVPWLARGRDGSRVRASNPKGAMGR